jgi:hypothetical protein
VCLARLGTPYTYYTCAILFAAWLSTASALAAAPLWRFDFGGEDTPVAAGWLKVDEKLAYAAGRDYGWRSTAGLVAVDCKDGDDLVRDFVAGRAHGKPARHQFVVRVANGTYAVGFVAGDLNGLVRPFRLLAQGKPVAARVGTGGANGWDAQTFVVQVGNGALELTFEAETSWHASALVVGPVDQLADVQAAVEQVEERFALRAPKLQQGRKLVSADEGRGDVRGNPDRERRGYVVFTRPYAAQIFPTTVPNEIEVGRPVRLMATAGEHEPASVAVRAWQTLRNVRLEVGPLAGPQGNLPANALDVRVVRCWPQLSGDEPWNKTEYRVVPELLEPQGRHGELWMRPLTTRQFWLTLHVPAQARSGFYRGTLTVRVADAEPTALPLEVEVLPFRLSWGRPITRGVYFNPQKDTPDRLMQADLQNIRAHGMNGLAFGLGLEPGSLGAEGNRGRAWDLAYLRWLMGWLRRVGGFDGPLPLFLNGHGPLAPERREALVQTIRAVEQERKKQGWPEFLYYPVDEPFGGQRLDDAVEWYRACKVVPGIRTYCTVSAQAAERLSPWLDVRCHALSHYQGFAWPQARDAALAKHAEFWWYSNTTRHYFTSTRMKAGFFFWKVGATGQYYWNFRSPSAAPWTDFDDGTRDHIAAYPGLDGPIDTIQWECCREGLDDAQYAATLETVLAAVAKRHPEAPSVTEARRTLDELRAAVNVDLAGYDAQHPGQRNAFHYGSDWEPSRFDSWRRRLADAIQNLQQCDAQPASAKPKDADRLSLVEGGQSPYRIVTAANPPASTRYAAEELQRFVQQISGVRLPIVADTEPAADHEILVGRSNRLEVSGVKIDMPALGREGYVLRTAGQRLAIVGGEPRGTLYGVYGLLEDHFGCRWFTPEIARIPRQPTLTLPMLDERKVPVFEYRETYTWESYDADWMARNRLNGAGGRGRLLERQGIRPPVPELEARHGGSIRFGFGFFVHTLEKIIPAKPYFDDHPEYFALWKGRRNPHQMCCTNDDVVRLCTEGILKGMREQPEATVFSLSQNDNMIYCQCERCQAIARREETPMGPMLYLVNRVAEATEREFPDQIVETLAYVWSRRPPKSMRPRPNVVIRLCDIECCFAHPLASGCTPRNQAFVDDLEAWSKCCDRLWIWDYTTNYAHYLLPLPNKRLLADNIRLFAANRAAGVFEQGTYDTPDSELVALKAYLIAKFLWNPNYDAERATGEFLDAYYGPAAALVAAYIDLVHDYADHKPVHVGIYVPPTYPHLTPALLAEADRLWQEAESRAANDPALLDRVRRSRMSVDYAIVEQGRAAAKTPAAKRSPPQSAVLALARKRCPPFVDTLIHSHLTRIREWKDFDKADYGRRLTMDLGLQ